MITFTQFLRPNGFPKPIMIDRSAEIEVLANEINDVGGRFEIEELRTGMISMTVELVGKEDEGPIAMEVCPNGPLVPQHVDLLVRSAHRHLFESQGRAFGDSN